MTLRSVTVPAAKTPDNPTLSIRCDALLCLPSQPFNMAKFAKCSYFWGNTTLSWLWMVYMMNRTGPKTSASLRRKRGGDW
jgi:hypothetical protein